MGGWSDHAKKHAEKEKKRGAVSRRLIDSDPAAQRYRDNSTKREVSSWRSAPGDRTPAWGKKLKKK